MHRGPVRRGDEIGPDNAIPLLINRIMRLAERAWSDPKLKPKRERVPFLTKAPVVHDPAVNEQPAPTPQPVTSDPELQAAFPLVLASGTASAQLIDDNEYPPRWRESIATSNWRQSVERNARIAQEREERRRDRWIG